MSEQTPRIVVFTTVFPNQKQPNFGLFVRERMFRVAKQLPLCVVAPVPWFPGQGLLRKFRPHFRPQPHRYENMQGIDVHHPRFLSFPGIFKSLDGLFLAWSCRRFMRQLKQQFEFNLIDAHFSYPDGYAATKLGQWLNCPVTITLRGTEVSQGRYRRQPKLIRAAHQAAAKVFSVSQSLVDHVCDQYGSPRDKMQVVGNGIDIDKFVALPRDDCRKQLQIDADATVLITVGGLCERKGFHRVLELLPALLQRYPKLLYLVVGGATAEGDWTERLQQQVAALGLQQHVRFTGPQPHDQLKYYYSAADLFVLPTRNEGWANVFLEAMACGLPAVATDVGGNAEVVADASVGQIVPFGDAAALQQAIEAALAKNWDRQGIIAYAKSNTWEQRIQILLRHFQQIVNQRSVPPEQG